MSANGRVFLYDITRLISRSNAPAPTGIDRVDIRYAKYLKETQGDNCVFVIQQHNHLYLYDFTEATQALDMLWQRWISGQPLEETQVRTRYFTPPHRINGEELEEVTSKPEDIPQSDVEYLFKLPYWDRVRFVTSQDLKPYVPNSLEWFLRLPFLFKFPIFLICVCRIPLLHLLSAIGKFLYSCFTHLHSSASKFLASLWRLADLGVTSRFTKKTDTRIDEKLSSVLTTRSHSDLILVNTSHLGLGEQDIFFELKFNYNVNFVFFIHDIIPILFPEYVKQDTVSAHFKRMQTVAKFKPSLIFNSLETQQSVKDLFEKQDWPMPPSEVGYIGVEEKFLSKTHGAETKEYSNHFVMLGTIEPRKNHLFILNLWRELSRSDLPEMPKLYVVGRRGWENENIIDMLERCPAIQDHVIELSGVSDDIISKVVSSSRALLFPSFSEGWGMPLVEALSLGAPAICSDIPVLHEAGQGIPEYLHPLDFNGWRDMIVSYSLDNSETRAAQIKRLQSFEPPRWADHWDAFASLLPSER
jgi:glycosyltransferase involved in cell wall biosynthesis